MASADVVALIKRRTGLAGAREANAALAEVVDSTAFPVFAARAVCDSGMHALERDRIAAIDRAVVLVVAGLRTGRGVGRAGVAARIAARRLCAAAATRLAEKCQAGKHGERDTQSQRPGGGRVHKFSAIR